MERGTSRFKNWQARRECIFSPEASSGELDLRDRVGRQLRARLRQMKPTVLLAPRWSQSRSFLEAMALEMALAQPAMTCHGASFSGLRGHRVLEARQRMLGALAELSADHWSEVQVPHVATDAGFILAAEQLLMRAQEQPGRIALFVEGVERLHVDVLATLSEAWNRFADKCGGDRAVVLMLAGTLPSQRLDMEEAIRVDLPDYASGEAIRVLSPDEALGEQGEMALAFSGGVPSFVGALAEGVRKLGGLPYSATGLIRLLGPLENEVRHALDLVAADPVLADRLESLSQVERDVLDPVLDDRLLAAGMLRELRPMGGRRQVALRAPLLAAILG